MKLPRYNIQITISDPKDTETYISVSSTEAEREKLLDIPIIGAAVKAFEEMVNK